MKWRDTLKFEPRSINLSARQIIVALRLERQNIFDFYVINNTTNMITKQKGDEKVLHVLSDFVNMRFALLNNKTYLSEKSRRNKRILEQQHQASRQSSVSNSAKKDEKAAKPQTLLKLDMLSSAQSTKDARESDEAHFRLKFLERLSEEHLIIGNEYQIDMLRIGGAIDGFLDVEHKWTVNPQAVVHTLSVERKFSLIAVASTNRIWVYRYDLKKDNQHPKMIVNCCHGQNEKILQVRFIKNAGIYTIFERKIQYYKISWVCEKAELMKCFTYSFEFSKNMSVFSVPEPYDSTLNVYFYQNRKEGDKFNLWMQSFVSLARVDAPQVGKMIRIYSLEQEVKEKIEIFNFNSQICLIQFQNKLIAFKNGFVIDAVSTNIHQPSYFIKYVPNKKTLFHFLDNVIDIYTLSMVEKTKPEKFKLMCRDCIEFSYKHSGNLLSILHLGNNSFAFFFQTAESRTNSDHPNITYRFAITQPVNLRDKLDQIYPTPEEIHKHSLEELYQKSNMAEKIGLSKRDAFLELWLRSSKSSITDFQILLSTRHFPTIQSQIQHKLKRQSMSIRQMLKIYGQCLTMLHERVYSETCKSEDLQQYASCHFLIRKLEMLRWIFSQGNLQEGAILVNIKDYYEYKDLSIISAIVDLVYSYINHPSTDILLKLRAIFKFFKLVCKIEYQQILSRLVSKCKLKILQILKVLPQLLPYQVNNEQEISIGLWKQLAEQQLEESLFLSQITTIDNRERVQQFPKSLWFKRYQYTSHGVIKDVDRKAVISYLSEKNNSESMFYMFLCKVYHLNIFNHQLRQLISYIQQKYDLMPQHLRGKLELYLIMYSIFAEIDKSLTLYQFLKFKQHQLFKLYFQREKAEKGGFILKKIKPLYEQLLNKGKDIFNQGMFDYFSSEESTVSDLKCILSKLNNEKNEFHINSEQLYEVLINAIMQKIKVGSNCDTPIDEILVYIENIPFPIHNECIMTNLEYIQEINFESQMLRRIHVDMTLAEIVKNGEKVIQMMVDHQIQRHQMQRIRDYRSLRLHAYKILAEIQCRKSNIYGDRFHSYSLKIFLINVMNNNDLIPLCKQLLSDKYLIEEFQIDDAFKQSVVMHLYQWKLSRKHEVKNPYKNHLQFINLIVDLLDKSNSKRKFIEASMKYASLFTLQNYQIEYPLFPTFKYYPALVDIQSVLSNLNASDLTKVQLEKVFDVMVDLKKLGQAQMNATFKMEGYEDKLKLQLYEIYLVRLVEERQLKLALKFAEVVLSIPNEFSEFNIIYPILIIERTYEEVLQNTAALLNRLISYLFRKPKQLCHILSKIYSIRLSNYELDSLLLKELKNRQNQLAFSPTNTVFQKWIGKAENPLKCNQILEICLERILKVNEVYRKNHTMQIMFRLMCHEPLAMSKWIWCKGSGINMKTLRSFVSYMSMQILFDADSILKATIDALQVLSFKYTNNIFFSQIIKFKTHLQTKTLKYNQNQTQQNHDAKVIKLITQSIELLQQKRQAVKNENIAVLKEKQNLDYNQFIKDPKMYQMKEIAQYVYSDRDDAYEDLNDELSIKSKWKSKHDSNRAKNSEVNGLKIYEEIPLPTAVRHRKNSQYFPEMLDVEQNFDVQKVLKASFSQQDLLTVQNQAISHYPIYQIPEDEGENLNSMMLIRIESGNGEHNLKQLSRLQQTESICMEGYEHQDEIYSNQQQFKIEIKGQSHVEPDLLASRMLKTIDGDSGVYDLSQLRIEARKQKFREYLEKVLDNIYKNKEYSFQKCMKLIATIIDQYQRSEQLNKDAVNIFKKLSHYKAIQGISFNFRQALPITMIFSENIENHYQHFQRIITIGLNSLQVFPRAKFVEEIIGEQWKLRILEGLILNKAEHIYNLKEKISKHSFAQQEQKKILKDLQMDQLKITVLIEQNQGLINRLEKICYTCLHSKNQHKRVIAQIIKMSLSSIKFDVS